MSKQRLRPNCRNGIRRIEQTAPPPTRKVVQDDEFIRDIFALVGKVADVGQQFRPLSIDTVAGGLVITLNSRVNAALHVGRDIIPVFGEIGGTPFHERGRRGELFQAVAGLLERHNIDPAISDREPAEVVA